MATLKGAGHTSRAEKITLTPSGSSLGKKSGPGSQPSDSSSPSSTTTTGRSSAEGKDSKGPELLTPFPHRPGYGQALAWVAGR